MAHALSQNADDAYEMMCVCEKPWHRLGTVLRQPPATAAEAVAAAHLGWRVEKKQLYIGAEGRPLPREFAMVREDRWERAEEEAIFGQVGEDYEPLQNTDAFQFFDPMIKKHEAFYESAGALYNGKCVWVMAKLHEDIEVVAGDPAMAFVLIIGEAERFQCGKQVASYLGLVPLEDSSGNRRRLGHITKQGSSILRFLLVEAAQVTVRSLPEWRSRYFHLTMRRGRKIAKVAMARRLAVCLYWMMRQGWAYQQWIEFGSYAGQPGNRHGAQ